MSVQDKIEHILKNIHLLFSGSKSYNNSEEWIIVEKNKVFELLQQLNLAVYEAMDEYEITNQKHELAERRCEKRGEELIQKASSHADDIYAASIMYTDDAINRICHIMEDANASVQNIFRKLDKEMEDERERVRRNQLELTGQLQDFADTDKYVKLIREINKKLERERMQQARGEREKRIQNQGKSYSAVQPDIRVNEAYFERANKSYELTQPEINPRKDEEESLARVTGKEFAESLRRRAARTRRQPLEIEDMSGEMTIVEQRGYLEGRQEPVFSQSFPPRAEAGNYYRGETAEELDLSEKLYQEAMGMDHEDEFYQEIPDLPEAPPEIRVDLDAEYFRWKESAQGRRGSRPGKKERRLLFGKK